MEVITTDFPGVLLLRPLVHRDGRGFFLESWNQRIFDQAVGRRVEFVQDNRLFSVRGVLRGLHYQVAPLSQGKLVSVLTGAIFDVAVDLRRESPTYGRSFGCTLKAEDHDMIWLPPGFAHGFLATSDSADVIYKSTEFYSLEHQRRIRWDDPDLAIPWPLHSGEPVLSPEDAEAPYLRDIAL